MMCHASFGGSARIGIELAIALSRRGHHVHLFTHTTPFGRWTQQPHITLHTLHRSVPETLHPATLHTNWSAEDLQNYTEDIMRVIATEGLDVLHFHYAMPFAFVVQRLRDYLGEATPWLVGTLHGTDVTHFGKEPATGVRLTKALHACDIVTTVSASHAELATTVFNLDSPPHVVPNFIDGSRFYPPRRQHGERHTRSRPRIIHISNFRPIKDPQSMARIFLGIRARLDAELWLIGDGEEMPAVRALMQHSAFADDVHYVGLQTDIVPALHQADLLLMTSRYESFCLVALEAMACGVPVLATRVGGLPEVVRHGQTGLLFPLGAHDVVVDMAVGLLSEPPRLRAMRDAATHQARQFHVEHVVPAYEALYQPQVGVSAVSESYSEGR
jgi:N-acetyl-alpha-D-glucosaminyl L-malate synthase BshA